MTFDLVTTDYGPAALNALGSAVRQAKDGEPLAPVTVVVPSNHVGVTARRHLAAGPDQPLTPHGRGTIAVTFLTPYRLAELLGAPLLAASGRRPVSTPVITAAIRSALRVDPGVFAPVVDHPATEEALVTTYTELADLSAPAMEALAAASPRAADVVRLFGEARALLAASWYDETDLTTAARSALGSTGEHARSLGHLVVYLPQSLTQRSAALLRDAAQNGSATAIAGLTGREPADRDVRRSLRRLGIGLGPDEPPASPPRPSPAVWPVSDSRTRVVTTSDADEEIRVAVEAVIDAARDGVALERTALLFPTREPYARLAYEHVKAAGLPVNGTAVRGLAERTYGQAMLHVLALRDRGYRRHDVLGLLTGAPITTATGAPAPTTVWERLSREAGVVAGRSQWDRLVDLADQLDLRADDIEAEGEVLATGAVPESNGSAGSREDGDDYRRTRAEQYRRRATRARDLHQLVVGLVDDIEQAAANPQRWRDRVRWLRRVTGKLVGGETAWRHWPDDDERQAATRVEAALDRLAALDEIDQPCTLDVFRRTLELELEADLGRVGRFGEGLLVAPLSFGVGLDLDLVVVVGAAEGLLPARLADDSLLPDHERARTQGELPLRRDQSERQERQLYAALAAAQAHVLVAPRGDLRATSERSVSRWLDEMGTPNTRTPQTSTGASAEPERPPTREDLPSFAHRVRHTRFPATEQEYRLQATDRPDRLADDDVTAAGRDLVTNRQSARFTRFDGNLDGLPIRPPVDEIVSATRLEAWATCPHAYLMRHILRVEQVEDPADQLWISPLDKGSLIHEVLERFVLTVLERPAGGALPAGHADPDQPWSDDDHALMRQIASEVCADYEARGVVGRRLFWRRDRDRLLALLDRFLHDDDIQRRLRRSHPVAAEMAFGLPRADLPPVEVPIAGGRRLYFRGSADRIDVGDDGTLRVVDYKTGRPYDYMNLSEQNPDDRGTHLQLAVYGVAARRFHDRAAQGPPGDDDHDADGGAGHDSSTRRKARTPVMAEYWFVSENDRLKTVGYRVTDEVLDHVGSTLATIVDGVAAGVFPARPTASSSDPFVRCRYCDPDGLGVADRRREWDRKRQDPALAAYVELAEPAEPAEDEGNGQ